MKRFMRAIVISGFAVISASAFAQGNANNDTPPLTPAETAQAKVERLAAQAKWASMTPGERAAVTRQRQAKRLAYLSDMEAISNNDTPALTVDETAELKAMRDAARASWAAMSDAERMATKQMLQQRMQSELTTLERVAGPGQ